MADWKRLLLAALVAVGFAVAQAPNAEAGPGDDPCGLVISFVCRFLPIEPDLDHDIDLTQPSNVQAPPAQTPDPAR